VTVRFDYWIYWTLAQLMTTLDNCLAGTLLFSVIHGFTRRCFATVFTWRCDVFHQRGFLRRLGTNCIENTACNSYFACVTITEEACFKRTCYNTSRNDFKGTLLFLLRRKYVGLYRLVYVPTLSVLEQNDRLSRNVVWTLCLRSPLRVRVSINI
jgi:hypothetical protein